MQQSGFLTRVTDEHDTLGKMDLPLTDDESDTVVLQGSLCVTCTNVISEAIRRFEHREVIDFDLPLGSTNLCCYVCRRSAPSIQKLVKIRLDARWCEGHSFQPRIYIRFHEGSGRFYKDEELHILETTGEFLRSHFLVF